MKRRLFSLILAALFLLSVLPEAMAASSIDCRGDHSWGSWHTDKEPTCTENGSHSRTCNRCGQKQTDTVPKLEHNVRTWTVTQEAGCTTDGMKEGVCRRCGKTEKRIIFAKGHSFGEWFVIAEAGEQSKGLKKRVCSACGLEETEEFYPDGTLTDGMTGKGVRELQKLLLKKGYYEGEVDGGFGALTLAAVKKAETDAGLTVDGIAWPVVIEILKGDRVPGNEDPGKKPVVATNDRTPGDSDQNGEEEPSKKPVVLPNNRTPGNEDPALVSPVKADDPDGLGGAGEPETPAIKITGKITEPPGGFLDSDTVPVHFEITNVGNVTLEGVQLYVDDTYIDAKNHLAPGETYSETTSVTPYDSYTCLVAGLATGSYNGIKVTDTCELSYHVTYSVPSIDVKAKILDPVPVGGFPANTTVNIGVEVFNSGSEDLWDVSATLHDGTNVYIGYLLRGEHKSIGTAYTITLKNAGDEVAWLEYTASGQAEKETVKGQHYLKIPVQPKQIFFSPFIEVMSRILDPVPADGFPLNTTVHIGVEVFNSGSEDLTNVAVTLHDGKKLQVGDLPQGVSKDLGNTTYTVSITDVKSEKSNVDLVYHAIGSPLSAEPVSSLFKLPVPIDKTKMLDEPDIAIVATILDPASQNGVYPPYETVSIGLEVINTGNEDLTGVTVELHDGTIVNIGDLPTGATASAGKTSYTILPENVPTDTNVIELYYSAGGTGTTAPVFSAFTLPIKVGLTHSLDYPAIYVKAKILDPIPEDGFPRGSKVNIGVTVINTGNRYLTDVEAVLHDGTTVPVKNLASGVSADVGTTSYEISSYDPVNLFYEATGIAGSDGPVYSSFTLPVPIEPYAPPVPYPAIEVKAKVTKSAPKSGFPEDAEVPVRVTVTNIGTEDLTGVTLTLHDGSTVSIGDLSKGDQVIKKTKYYVTFKAAKDGQVVLDYSADGVAVTGEPVSGADSVNVLTKKPYVVEQLKDGILIKKEAAGPVNGLYYEEGETVYYTVTVQNCSSDTAMIGSVTDKMPHAQSTALIGNTVLYPNETLIFNDSYVVVPEDIKQGAFTNFAKVSYTLVQAGTSGTAAVSLTLYTFAGGVSCYKEVVNEPKNGSFFTPNEEIRFKVSLRFKSKDKKKYSYSNIKGYDIMVDSGSTAIFTSPKTKSAAIKVTHTVTPFEVETNSTLTNYAWFTMTDEFGAPLTVWSNPVTVPIGIEPEGFVPETHAPLTACRCTLGESSGESATYELEFCEEHQRVSARAADLLEQGDTEGAILLWREAADTLYTRFGEAVGDEHAQAVRNARDTFFAEVDAYAALEAAADPESSREGILTLLESKCVDLCSALTTAPKERADGLPPVDAEFGPDEDGGFACGIELFENGSSGASLYASACGLHADAYARIIARAAGAETPEQKARELESGLTLWKAVTDQVANELYTAVPDETLAEYKAFFAMLDARRDALALLYPDDPATVAELLLKDSIAHTLLLCPFIEEPEAGETVE